MLDADPAPGDATRVHLPHPEILAALEPGHTLLLDDGKVRLIATEVDAERAVTRVEVGGKLSDRKGVSLPDTTIAVLGAGRRRTAPISKPRSTPASTGSRSPSSSGPRTSPKPRRSRAAAPRVMAKIEKPQAVTRLDEILEITDALMVARGDLGVEMPLEKVPGIQKQITRAGAARRQAGGGRDADARIDDHEPGADARRSLRRRDRDLRGRRRRDAVGRIRRRPISGRGGRHDEPHRRGGGERSDSTAASSHAQRTEPEATGADAIAAAARQIAETLDLAAIVCWTSSGSTALRVARERPQPPIVAISPNLATGAPAVAGLGRACVVAEDAHDQDDMVDRACRLAFREGFAKAGQRVIVVAGVPLGTPGATNMLRIAFVGSEAPSEM